MATAINIKEKEKKVLLGIANSDYIDYSKSKPEELIGYPTWMWDCKDNSGLSNKSFSGVCSSLHEKGLIVSDITGDRGMINCKIEDTYTITLTALGVEAIREDLKK
jgi:hypothetical protein